MKIEDKTKEQLNYLLHWKTAFNTINDGICIIDSKGTIINCNLAMAKITGKLIDEIIGHKCYEIMHNQPERMEKCPFLSAYNTHSRETIEWSTNDRWFNIIIDPVEDENDNVIGCVHIMSDITARKQAEDSLQETNRRLEEALAELKKTQQQIVQQERLRALGQMASGIAHDFNNSLTPILGFSELLLANPEILDDKDKVIRYVQTINTSAQDAANIVSRLREFYRYREETEIFSPVNLNQIIKQTIFLTQPRWKDQALAKGININFKTELQEIPNIPGSESGLREVLTNLIFNAVDAMPESGTITIRTYQDNKNVLLEVSDTGTGMTEEVRRHCIEPFFSTKEKEGTGLGLSMVYGIVKRHEGTIDIESEVGKGTTFTIKLPIQTIQKAKSESKNVETTSPSLHILVVDDEPLVRETISEYLMNDGHSIVTANNGLEGLEKFNKDKFDLVITDRSMPKMSGDQMASIINQIAIKTPVILLTGFGDMMETSGEKPAGVDSIVSKPVTLKKLRETLTMILEKQKDE